MIDSIIWTYKYLFIFNNSLLKSKYTLFLSTLTLLSLVLFGINKEYNLDSLNNIKKTTIVFKRILDDYVYYVPVTKINNDQEEKINIIINELKSSVNSQNNLNSNLPDNIVLINYTLNDNNMKLVFNNDIDEDSKYLISESIYENYDVDKITFDFINKSWFLNKVVI